MKAGANQSKTAKQEQTEWEDLGRRRQTEQGEQGRQGGGQRGDAEETG